MEGVSRPGLWPRLVRTYVGFCYRRPAVPVVLLALVTWGSLLLGERLRIDTDLRVLLPKGTPSVIALEQAERRLGSTDFYTLAFEAPSADAVGRFQKDLADSVRAWRSDVVWVQYDHDKSFFERHALMYLPVDQLDDLRARVAGLISGKFARANPLIEDLGGDAGEGGGPAPQGLEGWPDPKALRKQGLPQDIVDGLMAKVKGMEGGAPDSAAPARADTTGLRSRPMANAPGDTLAEPPRPDSLRNRLMGWHPEKKVWVGVVLAQLRRPSTDAIYAKGMFERGEALIASMRPERYDPAMVAKVAGAYRNFSEINQVTGDIVRATAISFALMVGLLWLFVRRPINLVLINIPLFVAMAWATAATYLIYQRLTLLTAFILALILGLGIEYTVHLYSRWAEENRRGLGPLEAMIAAVTATGRSLAAGAATNIFAMLSLQFGHFKGFKEYGVVVSAGIVLCLLTTWLVIPPTFLLCIRLGEWVQGRFAGRPALRKLAGWILPGEAAVHGGLLLPEFRFGPGVLRAVALAGLLFTGAISFGPQVGFENDFSHLRGKSTSAGISYGRAVGGGRSTSPAIILGNGEAQMRAVHDSLSARYGNPADSMLESFATIQSFVPSREQQGERAAALGRLDSLLDLRALDQVDARSRARLDLLRRYARADTFGYDSLPDWAKRFLTEADGSHGRIGYLYGRLRESDALESDKFQRRFQFLPAGDHDSVMVASTGFIYADVVRSVKADGPRLALWTLLFLVLITWLDMRSLRGVAVTVGFIVLSAYWTYRIMALLGLKLGMYNLVVLPTILSVSVDSVIHLYHRRMELGAGKIPELIHTTGSAVLAGTLNNAFGFVGLCFVAHKGMQTIGFLATLGIGAGLVIMFTILPWALEALCPREPRH